MKILLSLLTILFLGSLVPSPAEAAARTLAIPDDPPTEPLPDDEFPQTDGTKCQMDCRENPEYPGSFSLYETGSVCGSKPGTWICSEVDESAFYACFSQGVGKGVAGLCYDYTELPIPDEFPDDFPPHS